MSHDAGQRPSIDDALEELEAMLETCLSAPPPHRARPRAAAAPGDPRVGATPLASAQAVPMPPQEAVRA